MFTNLPVETACESIILHVQFSWCLIGCCVFKGRGYGAFGWMDGRG